MTIAVGLQFICKRYATGPFGFGFVWYVIIDDGVEMDVDLRFDFGILFWILDFEIIQMEVRRRRIAWSGMRSRK